ncbi:MAG: DegT/DnrJ/EryC1/StrS family aminotransferase [Candidatus Omnitrophota bacterium]
MQISILDLKGQYETIKKEVKEAVDRVVESQNFILGEDLKELEKEIARYCNTKYAVGVASGTDALLLSLMALGIKPGDEVITSPFTFFSSAEVISLVGAKPVFVDIDPKTYNIDPNLIERKISKRTKAIIPVHLYGQCAEMDPILAIAGKHGLKIVEDCAQAIGAVYKGKKAGSMGDLGALSFFPSKNLGAFGEGGMVVTNDKSLAERLTMLRVHGSSVRYVHAVIGTNSRLDNIQAAVLRVKLRYLDKWLAARRANAMYYNENLKTLPLILPYVPSHNIHTYHQYVLRVRSGLEKLMRFLVDGGVETRTYYPIPLHLQECYKSLGYKKGDLKESEAASLETFAIAVYPELKIEQKDYVIKKIMEFFKR